MASLALFSFSDGPASFALTAGVKPGASDDVLTLTTLDIAGSFDAPGGNVSTSLDIDHDVLVEVPRALLRKDDENCRLPTEAEVADLARHEVEKLDAARRRFKDRLADPIIVNPGTGAFGVTAFDRVEIRFAPTLVDLRPKLEDDTVILGVTAYRSVDFSYKSVNTKGKFVFGFEVKKKDLANLADALLGAFRFDIPNFRGFDLGLPKFRLPSLGLGSIDLSFDLQSPDLPSFLPINLPKIPSIDIKGEWVKKPKIKVSIDNDDLQLTTPDSERGTFELKIEGKAALVTASEIDVELAGGKLDVSATVTGTTQDITVPKFEGPGFLPLGLRVEASKLKPEVTVNGNDVSLKLTHEMPRISIWDKGDPAVDLHLAMTVTYETDTQGGGLKTDVAELKVIAPYPIELIRKTLGAAQDVIRFIGSLDLPEFQSGPDVSGARKVMERLVELLAAAGRWLAEQAAAAGQVLAGIAEAIGEAIEQVFDALTNATNGTSGFKSIAVDLRLDPKSWRLRQLIVMPAGGAKNADFTGSFLGFELSVGGAFRPALVIDAVHDWFGMVLLPGEVKAGSEPKITLATDLWLERGDGPRQPLGTMGDDGAAATDKPPRLIKLTGTALASNTPRQIVLAAIQSGRLKLFQTVETSDPESLDLNGQAAVSVGTSGPLVDAKLQYGSTAKPDAMMKVEVAVDPEIKKRALSILPKPSGDGGEVGKLVQRIKIEDVKTELADVDGRRQAQLSFDLSVLLGDGFAPKTSLAIAVDLTDLSARITGGERIAITTTGEKNYEPLGLNLALKPEKPTKDPWEVFTLDLARGAERFSLGKDALAELSYKRVSTSGRGLLFQLKEFAASRAGFDLDATIKNEPVTLGGVDVPVRFTSGHLTIKGSEFQGASLAGSVQLPPALVGEANASIAMQLGKGADGNVEVLGATARLDKSGDPIRCNATMFDLTITELGFDFVNEGSYHFYFLVTGSAVFRPSGGAFSDGLLKRFKELEIKLDKAPIGGDPRVLLRSISFLVKVDPPKRTNFFDLFSFDLKGIGFYPAAEKFGGDPAMAISGQVKFAEFGDKISPRFDFHKMWIAGPADGGFLPRVRFDGLTVGLKTGALDVEATAIAVDDSMPDLYRPDVLPANIRAEGFLASGRIDITGWATMSGAMGFLQLSQHEGPPNPRHAFFVYGQLEKLTEPIDTPVGTIYLREFGFGLGYRYTLAGIAQAETATSPRDLIRILDEVSKYQGNLNRFEAWEPTYDNSDLTLALRGMFSIAAVRGQKYNEKGEKGLANPLLFDIVVARRTDLTFLINLRGWIAVNYNDWVSQPTGAAFKSNPTVRGYLYFSVPRKEFLARMVSEPGGHVGEHPKLPKPLIQAIQAVRFSSTLYIRPGLFHMEFGWPYELGFDLGKPSDTFYLKLRGGLINRIEDFSLLYGMAFKADGAVRFGGRVGNDNFGASATAEAVFSLEAKILAYLSLKRFDDSLFYGLLRFDMTISVRVSVWLSFKILRKRIRLSVGFSLHLAVSIGLEAVITPEALGGRAHVAVGVRAFGRTLSVGIGLSFNDGLLNQARARVARFQALGLTTDIPPEGQDGRRAERAPRPDLPRKETTAAGDARIDDELAKLPAPVANDDAPPQEENYEGRDFSRTDFWAMLFPVPGREKRRYVLQLIPRDGTQLEQSKLAAPPDMFYASPKITEGGGALLFTASHELKAASGDVLKALRQISRNKVEDQIADGSVQHSVEVNTFHTVDKGDAESGALSVGELLSALFLQRPGSGGTTPILLSEPRLRQIVDEVERLEDDPEASADRLGQIGRSRAHLTGLAKRETEIEESRSAILATVMETAEATARGIRDKTDDQGETRTVAPEAASDLDGRDLGLTFLVDEDGIDALFEADPDADGLPRRAKFTVHKSDAPNGKGTVHLFNPPERMFRSAHPRLEPKALKTADGIKIDWDLEPAWGASRTLYDDPEQHLKHYLITRRIVGARDGDYPAEFTVKTAAPLRIEEHDNGTKVTAIHAPYQFVDDLRSGDASNGMPSRPVPEDIRNAILGLAPSPVRSEGLRVQYDIVPVDIAGTFDAGEPFAVEAEAPIILPAVSPIEATLQVVYEGMPSLATGDGGTPSEAKGLAALRLLLVEPPAPPEARAGRADPRFDLAHVGQRFELRIWRDLAVPSGGYGTDAVTAAKTRPGEEDISALSGEDVSTFTLELVAEDDKNKDAFAVGFDLPKADGGGSVPFHAKLAGPDGAAATMADLRATLTANLVSISGGTVSPEPGRSVRMFLRSLADPTETGVNPGEWRSVSTNLVLLGEHHGAGSRKPLPVNAVVETFEQPVALDFAALKRRDMQVRSGRLYLFRPEAQATLGALLGSGVTSAIRAAPDPARRTATRLRWNARPASLQLSDGTATGADNPDLFRWLCGFDIHRLDPDTLTGDATDPDALADAAEEIGSVRLLPASERGLAPAGFGDFSRLEMAFPSAAWRNAKAEGSANGLPPLLEKVPGKKPWFSQAESSVVFPRPRLRRCLLPELDEGFVAEMFTGGQPDAVTIRLTGFPEPPQVQKHVLQGWRLAVVDHDGRFEATAAETAPWTLTIEPEAKKRLTVARLRALFRNLVIVPVVTEGSNADRGAAQAAEDKALKARLVNPEYLAALTLTVTAARNPIGTTKPEDRKITATVTQEIDILPAQHPILADTLAFLVLSDQTAPGTAYLRYALTPDDAPESEAATFTDYLDEVPTERDPHGFSALRTLGLAAGFQLFDTETGAFLKGEMLFARVKAAFDRARALYQIGMPDRGEADEGLPFADILTRPWGNARLFWFDGGQDSLQASDARQVRDDDTLAVMQISLRPLPDRLVQDDPERPDPETMPVHHVLLKRSVSDDDLLPPVFATAAESGEPPPRAVRYRIWRVEAPRPHNQDFLVDIVPPAAGLETLPPHRVTFESPGVTYAGFPADQQVLAVLRLAQVQEPEVANPENINIRIQVVFENVHGEESEPVDLSPDVHFQRVTDVFDRTRPGEVEIGMGRFDVLTSDDWADVLFRPSVAGGGGTSTLRLNPILGIEHLFHYAARRFQPVVLPEGRIAVEDGKSPVEDQSTRDKRAEIAEKLTQFASRFLDHCAVPAKPNADINFSLGTVADPGTWSQAPDSRGRLSVVILDVDRRGARRAFAIRPVGRYADWARAASWRLRRAQDGSTATAVEVDLQGLKGALPANAAMTHFVHATLPRTEPLEKPVILAARRVAENEGLTGEGRFEIAVAHPSDMILGAANRRNVALLAPGELSVGLWREFPYDNWLAAARLVARVDPDDWSPLARFGTGEGAAALEDTEGGTLSRMDAESRLNELRVDVPDAWQGTTVFAVSRLPYFFRIHMLVHASAGIVVSDHARAIFNEGFPLLSQPSSKKGPKTPAAPATWDVEDIGGVRRLVIDMPLVRFIDAMSVPDATLWFGADGGGFGTMEPVLHVPEPAVSYRVAIETLADPADSGPTRATMAQTFEIDIMPLQFEADPGETEKPMYSARGTGQVLALPGAADVEELLTPEMVEDDVWRMRVVADPGNLGPRGLPVADGDIAALHTIADQLGEADNFTFGHVATFTFATEESVPDEEIWEARFTAMSAALTGLKIVALEEALRSVFETRTETIGTVSLTTEVPARFWQDGAAPEAVQAFFGQDIAKSAAFLRMNHLPLAAEVAQVSGHLADPASFLRAVQDALFGANRRLSLLSMRGTLPPISAIIRHVSEMEEDDG